jgi:hypothetical protein
MGQKPVQLAGSPLGRYVSVATAGPRVTVVVATVDGDVLESEDAQAAVTAMAVLASARAIIGGSHGI